MPKKYATSVSCHTMYVQSRGLASTANGTSQITYCGDHTLFSMRNEASSRKHSCGSRGRRGAASASTAIAINAIAKHADDTRFSSATEGLPITGRLKCSNMYQTDPQSAPRDRLKA
jgi:hypothetical protein